MTGSGAEQVSEGKTPLTVARAERTSRRPAASAAAPAVTARFFLAKADGNGNGPVLDRELTTEAEAMLESLKTGLNYYSIVEWRAIADCAGKTPQVKKEAVGKTR